MILRPEMILSFVSYERENIIYHEKMLNLRIIILFIILFVIECFLKGK